MSKKDEKVLAEWARNMTNSQAQAHADQWRTVTPNLQKYIDEREAQMSMAMHDITMRRDEIRRNEAEIARLRRVCAAISATLRAASRR